MLPRHPTQVQRYHITPSFHPGSALPCHPVTPPRLSVTLSPRHPTQTQRALRGCHGQRGVGAGLRLSLSLGLSSAAAAGLDSAAAPRTAAAHDPRSSVPPQQQRAPSHASRALAHTFAAQRAWEEAEATVLPARRRAEAEPRTLESRRQAELVDVHNTWTCQHYSFSFLGF